MMRQIFNEVIKRNNFTPEEWKKVKIKVICKKGDVEDVSNYRPICSLPAMYKLFSTILYGRLYPMLDQNQAEDQAGFRKTYQTTDHLAMYRMLEQKCQEWGIKMWTATVDFTKAFDSISHNSIWEALLSCNVDHEYVSLLRTRRRQYRQTKRVNFSISKKVPNRVIRCPACCSTRCCSMHLKTLYKDGKKKGTGIYLSDQERDCLTNLRFADDVMLFATSKGQIQNMIVRIQRCNRESGTQDSPRQDENSQQ